MVEEPAPQPVEEPAEEEADDGSVAALARHFARFRGAASDADVSETAQQPL
jgi:hypothetical protein